MTSDLITRDFCKGDICNLSLVSRNGRCELVKQNRTPRDNDLMNTEASSVYTLRNALPVPWKDSIPNVFYDALLPDGTRSHVVEMQSGFFTCEQIKALRPEGLDGRTLAWMWRRLLSLLELVHGIGINHGAVLPPHVMFFPDNTASIPDRRRHSIRLIDWCYSFKGLHQRKAWISKWENMYPPRSHTVNQVMGGLDIYCGRKLMIYLAGPQFDSLPDEIRNHFSDENRPWAGETASEFLANFNGILARIYGPPKYHNFIIPGI